MRHCIGVFGDFAVPLRGEASAPATTVAEFEVHVERSPVEFSLVLPVKERTQAGEGRDDTRSHVRR